MHCPFCVSSLPLSEITCKIISTLTPCPVFGGNYKEALFSTFTGPILQYENSNDPFNYGEMIKQRIYNPKIDSFSFLKHYRWIRDNMFYSKSINRGLDCLQIHPHTGFIRQYPSLLRKPHSTLFAQPELHESLCFSKSSLHRIEDCITTKNTREAS